MVLPCLGIRFIVFVDWYFVHPSDSWNFPTQKQFTWISRQGYTTHWLYKTIGTSLIAIIENVYLWEVVSRIKNNIIAALQFSGKWEMQQIKKSPVFLPYWSGRTYMSFPDKGMGRTYMSHYCDIMVASLWHNVYRAVLATRDAHIITIFPAGNDIDLKHRPMIIIFNIFFNKLTWPEIHQKTSPSSSVVLIFENRRV